MNSKTLNKQRERTAAEYGMRLKPQQPNESDLAYFKRIAHTADQRMREIEAITDRRTKKYDPAYQMMKTFAYTEAQTNIRQWTGDKHKRLRFERSIPTNTDGSPNQQELHKRTRAVERFLMAPTSSKAATKKTFTKRVATFNRVYGTSFKWEEFANIIESGQFERMKATYGSPQFLYVIAAMQKLRKIGDSKANSKLSPDDLVSKALKSIAGQGERNLEKLTGKDKKTLDEIDKLSGRIKRVTPDNKILRKAIDKELERQGFTQADFSFADIDLTI